MKHSPSLPPRARVEPSAAIELSWLVIGCGKRNAVHTMAASLEEEVDEFWGDGERMLTELISIAHQLRCTTGWNIDPLLSVGDAMLDPTAELDLVTESEEERDLTRERIARLASDPALRKSYERLLRAVWAEAEPLLHEVGRARSSAPRSVRARRSSTGSRRSSSSPKGTSRDATSSCRSPSAPCEAASWC